MRVPPPAGPSRREWMQTNIQVVEAASKRTTTCSPSQASITRSSSAAISVRLAWFLAGFHSQSRDNGFMRQLSATHVRRLLPDLPPVGPAYQSLATSLRALILDGRL